MTAGLFGNPHSDHAASRASADAITAAKLVSWRFSTPTPTST